MTLKLVRQTAYATVKDPLEVRVAATNGTTTQLAALAVRVTVFAPTTSRSAYAQSLEVDGPILLPPVTDQADQTIQPGATEALPAVDLDLAAVGRDYPNGLLPVKVELLSGGIPLALLRTVVIFIEEEPRVPLNVALTVVLDAPLRMLPDGTFIEGALAPELDEGGRLDTLVSALDRRSFPLTLVVSPLLLDQLARMADGYRLHEDDSVASIAADEASARRARGALDRLRGIASRPDTELVALPYASPSVPSLAIPQLGEDLQAQISRGRRIVTEVLGVATSETMFRPPGGALSVPALSALADVGVQTLILDAESLESPVGLNLSPPPIAEVAAGASRSLEAILPDPGVEDRLDDDRDDPRLAAQHLIGELSALYFELPSDDRGVSILMDGQTPAPRFLASLIDVLTKVPDEVGWLRPAKASRLLTTITPEEPQPQRRELDPSPGPRFSEAFLTEMALTQAALHEYAAVAGEDGALVDRLRGLRFTAESRWLLHRQDTALAYLQSARRSVDREFAKIAAPPPTPVTLTSRGGPLPVTIRSQAQYAMRVRIVLRSTRLEFIGGSSREVTLNRPLQRFTFPVRAQTTGQFPVQILVQTPTGSLTITQSQIVVRSTAYNRVALVVTIGAALFLAAWWGRRFLPRRS